MELSKKNQKMIENLNRNLNIPEEQVIDTIITEYRARKAANRLEDQFSDHLLEFSQTDDEFFVGENLFTFLVAQYRQAMEKERNARFEREISIARPELVDTIYEDYDKKYELIERKYRFKRLTMAYIEKMLPVDYAKKKPFTVQDEKRTKYYFSVLDDYDGRKISKEEAEKRIARFKQTREMNKKANFENMERNQPEGEKEEAEFTHRKLEIEMKSSEITLARRKIDVYGPDALERAIREGNLPSTCSRGVLLINRALTLAFKKTDAGEWKTDNLSDFFEKLKNSLPLMGNLLTTDAYSREHAEKIYKLWKELGFVEKDIVSYFLDFRAIEFLK